MMTKTYIFLFQHFEIHSLTMKLKWYYVGFEWIWISIFSYTVLFTASVLNFPRSLLPLDDWAECLWMELYANYKFITIFTNWLLCYLLPWHCYGRIDLFWMNFMCNYLEEKTRNLLKKLSINKKKSCYKKGVEKYNF